MQCVRCLKESASVIAHAPDQSGAWELYYCEHCHYSWRNTEPDYITDISKRDPWAQLAGQDIEGVKAVVQSNYVTTKKRPDGL
ncbi:MAG: hypothetical protein LBG81_01950 [Coriobacteriaceae bacterium]|jgi:hypothetical protein|nr:hypothetical protein [Coriobacteriaceae bacterium]